MPGRAHKKAACAAFDYLVVSTNAESTFVVSTFTVVESTAVESAVEVLPFAFEPPLQEVKVIAAIANTAKMNFFIVLNFWVLLKYLSCGLFDCCYCSLDYFRIF